MKFNRSLLSAAALLATFSIQAQEVFKIAGGGGAKNGSVYSNMLATVAERCSSDALTIQETTTKGGTENLELLRSNKVKGAIVPSDVLANAKFDNASSVAQLKTIVTLHNEAAHLIARGDTKKEGTWGVGNLQFGGKEVAFNNPEDLKGRTIGAVGGSAVTARIISNMLRYDWKIDTSYTDTASLLAALTAGKLDAVMVQAGMQSDAVKSIKGNFKLIPLRGNSDTQVVYKPVKVEYNNLNGGRSVDTLASRALLMTRIFRSAEAQTQLTDLRACFYRELPKIQDADGTHPAWQDVDPTDHGADGFWYDLPKTASAEPVKAAKKK